MKNILFIFGLLLSLSSNAQNGLYLKIQHWGTNLDIEWLYLQDSFLVRNPKYGITPLQFDKEWGNNKENAAKIISSSDTKMALVWGNTINEVINLQIKNKELIQFKGVECVKAKPIHNNQFNDKLYSGLVPFNNLSKDIQLFLGKDGKFSLTSKSIQGASQKVEGSYTVNGNIISFTSKEGKNWQQLIHSFESNTDDLILDQQLFKSIQ